MAAAMRVMELHAPMQTVKRSEGGTATAKAAYRAAERVECERTGQVHDYSRKRGVEGTAILAPDDAPEWAHDRQRLWNEAEARERRKDAQTAREIHVAFPAEFSPQQRKAAGLQIGQWLVNRYGCAVDIAWHEPGREGDQRNHHAHMLFTARRFENGGWAAKKDNPLDSPKTSPEELKQVRASVAGVMNNISAREKLGVYVEHVSFEQRGLDKEPTKHLGPAASEMERRGVQTDRGELNRQIEARNAAAEKLHQDRKIVDIQQAREELAQKLASRKQDSGQKMADRPAPTREEVSPVITFHPAAWTPFYAETHKRRQEMLEEQDRLYRAREDELKKQMAALHQSIDNRNMFVRFWRRVTGKTAAEREELSKATSLYDGIQEKKRLAQEAFEKDRQQRMERLKEEYREREAQMHEERIRAEQFSEAQAEEQRRVDEAQRTSEAQEAEMLRQESFRQQEFDRQAQLKDERRQQDSMRQSPAPLVPEPTQDTGRDTNTQTVSAPKIDYKPSEPDASQERAEEKQRQSEIDDLAKRMERGRDRGRGMG
jgi:hypothetical protein